MQRSSSWTRFTMQGLGVTASILLALAVDAGWGYRQDRIEEREALVQLRAEFGVNRGLLDAARAAHQRILDQAYGLVDELDRLRMDPSHDIPDSLLAALWDWQTYDPVGGTLASLIASGNLGLIRNDSLRAAVASWPDVVADLNEDEITQRGAVRDHLLPFLARHLSFRQLLEEELPPLPTAPTTGQPSDLRDALLHPELENWLIDRIQGKESLLRPGGDLDAVRLALDEILGLLDREIDEAPASGTG